MATLRNAVITAITFMVTVSLNAQVNDKVDLTTLNHESSMLATHKGAGNWWREWAEITDPATGRTAAHILRQKRQNFFYLGASMGYDYTIEMGQPVGNIKFGYRGTRWDVGFGVGVSFPKYLSTSVKADERYASAQLKLHLSRVLWESNDINKSNRILFGVEALVSHNQFEEKLGEQVIETDTEIITQTESYHVHGGAAGVMGLLTYEKMLSPKNGIFMGVKAGAGYFRMFDKTNTEGVNGHRHGLCANGEIYVGVLLNKKQKSPLYYQLSSEANQRINEMR